MRKIDGFKSGMISSFFHMISRLKFIGFKTKHNSQKSGTELEIRIYGSETGLK